MCVSLSLGWLGSTTFKVRATRVTGPKGLRGRRPHSNCVSSNRVQQLSQSVCIGVTLSFGWLGKLSREAANRVRFEPRATFELRATSVPGPKGLRGRRPHSNCVSSNCVQQLSQNVCKGVTLFPQTVCNNCLKMYVKVWHYSLMYLMYLMYLVPELPVVPVVPENLISDMLVSPPFQKYIRPAVQHFSILKKFNSRHVQHFSDTFGTWNTWYLKYLWYLLYLQT